LVFFNDRHRDREGSAVFTVFTASGTAVAAPHHHHAHPYRILCAGMTDQGRQRQGNEDRLGIHAEVGLFVVADGMGGHSAGEVAAQMAVNLVREALVDTDVTWPSGMVQPAQMGLPRLVAAIERANHCIHGAAQQTPAWAGMGTTIVALLACGDRMALAHVGDSRIYRLRERRLELMTEDHSLFNLLVRMGRADPAHAEDFEQRNIITRALGVESNVEVDARMVDVVPPHAPEHRRRGRAAHRPSE
jgi:serine/threonine protein phosphatase PrpC